MQSVAKLLGACLLPLVATACSLQATSTERAPNYNGGESDGDPNMNLPANGPFPSQNLAPNGTARVTGGSLDLRELAGDGALIAWVPCGAMLEVVAGPSATPTAGWWRVIYTDATNTPYAGWASGAALVGASQFDSSLCAAVASDDGFFSAPDGGTTPTDDGGAPLDASTGVVTGGTSPAITAIFDRAQLGVGYSYWWGHGAWAGAGADIGSCSGNCPSCTHSGGYGADCSGFVSKAWQVPGPTPMTEDQHPYSTYEFYNDQALWTQLSRSGIMPADAMVYRSGSEGHIVLFDSGSDPFGDVWIYEARGCATGIQHDLRTIGSSYRTIRLNNP